ncbi:MAG: lysophospholipid acyltransferase family protein [Candidatus Binatia bacterium]
MMRWFLERLAYGGMWISLNVGRFAVRVFPRRLFLFLSEAIADLGFYLFHSFRKRSIRNLSLALGERLDAREIVRRSLRNFFRDFVEIGFALEASPEEIRAEIPLLGREHLEAALAKGKGAIALSAHLGNFFLVGTRLAIEGYPTYVLVNPPKNGSFRDLLVQYRLKTGQRTIHSRPQRQAFDELLRVLRQNELAVVIADEYRSGRGVYVPFFGRTVLARRGPATLALRTGAAVVPIYLIRDPSGRLTLIIEPEIELLRSGKIKTDVRENTLRITQWLERIVRSYPDQWNWMNIHWQQASLGTLI